MSGGEDEWDDPPVPDASGSTTAGSDGESSAPRIGRALAGLLLVVAATIFYLDGHVTLAFLALLVVVVFAAFNATLDTLAEGR